MPKTGTGTIEMLRALRIARRSAEQQRTSAINQMRSLVVTGPDQLRADLRQQLLCRQEPGAFGQACCTPPPPPPNWRCAAWPAACTTSTKNSPPSTGELATLVQPAAPRLLAVRGVGVQTAATLLTAAGDNPQRLRNERAFARLCGVAPIDMSSGKQQRHRLSRSGNRDANCALHQIVCSRLAYDERSRTYLARRLTQGKTRREAISCLKRYTARELFVLIQAAVTLGLDNP